MKFLTALVLAIGLSTVSHANGGGGVPTIPPVPERCITADRVMQIADTRGDEIAVDTTQPGIIDPFAKVYNETKPRTAFKFERMIIVHSPNPNVSVVAILLFFAEGPAQSCGAVMTMPKGAAAQIYAEARGRDA